MIFHLKGETINKVPKQRTSFHRNLAPRGEVNYRLWSRSRSFFPPRTCIPMHLSTIMQYDILSRTKQREPSKSLSIPRSSNRAMKCIRVFPFHSRHLSVIIIPLSMLLSTSALHFDEEERGFAANPLATGIRASGFSIFATDSRQVMDGEHFSISASLDSRRRDKKGRKEGREGGRKKGKEVVVVTSSGGCSLASHCFPFSLLSSFRIYP